MWGCRGGPAVLHWNLRGRGNRRGGRQIRSQDLTVLWRGSGQWRNGAACWGAVKCIGEISRIPKRKKNKQLLF